VRVGRAAADLDPGLVGEDPVEAAVASAGRAGTDGGRADRAGDLGIGTGARHRARRGRESSRARRRRAWRGIPPQPAGRATDAAADGTVAGRGLVDGATVATTAGRAQSP